MGQWGGKGSTTYYQWWHAAQKNPWTEFWTGSDTGSEEKALSIYCESGTILSIKYFDFPTILLKGAIAISIFCVGKQAIKFTWVRIRAGIWTQKVIAEPESLTAAHNKRHITKDESQIKAKISGLWEWKTGSLLTWKGRRRGGAGFGVK